MKKLLTLLIVFLSPVLGFSQAQLVINGTSEVTVVENGGSAATPIYIEINNPATTAIPAPVGTKGFIISENEWDMVKWDIGLAAAGTYQIPFGYNGGSSLYYLPLSFTLSGAGVGGTGLKFSTWHTQPDDWKGVTSLTGAASNVTQMGPLNGPGNPSNADNSYNAVSRFWVLDPGSYTTVPALSGITFTYISAADSSEIAPAGTPAKNLTPASLLAQRFNTSIDQWGDVLFGGGDGAGVGAGTNTTFSGGVSSANFFRTWTLASDVVPLPITLGAFSAQCSDNIGLIQWTSESEINNAYYTVQKTADNIHFETVATVKGAGNSSMPINYAATDNSPYPGTSYYILKQTDIDGNTTNPQGGMAQFTGCGTAPTTIVNSYNTSGYIEVQINSAADDNYSIMLTNIVGQVILNETHSATLGENEIRLNNNVPPGIYILSVRNDKFNYTNKLVLGVR